MSSHIPALPKGSRVLVTGANGFIASNIIDYLLNAGYTVRGTVRNPKPWLDDLFNNKYGAGSFESIIVPSFDQTEALDRACDGVSGLIHAASDLTLGSDPNAVIPWVVRAVLNVLQVAAGKPSIERVILMSSSSAAFTAIPGTGPLVIDENSYNDRAVKNAWDEHYPEASRGFMVYAASKTEGERAAWKWIKENRPNFVFNSILPTMVVGRLVHTRNISTMVLARMLLNGDPKAYTLFAEHWYVDVEDVARLCLICIQNDSVKSERLFAMSERLDPWNMSQMLREIRPDNHRIPDPPDDVRPWVEVLTLGRSEQLLRDAGYGGFGSVKKAMERGIEGLERDSK